MKDGQRPREMRFSASWEEKNGKTRTIYAKDLATLKAIASRNISVDLFDWGEWLGCYEVAR